MVEVRFFTPVVFDDATSFKEKITEQVDEYLNLGNHYRVKIYKPNAERPNTVAKVEFSNKPSWTNLVLKVISYFTVILPLIALALKYKLRSQLNFTPPANTESASQVNNMLIPIVRKVTHSQLEKTIALDLLLQVISFLSFKDKALFAQTDFFARDAIRQEDLYYSQSMLSIRAEIDALLVASGPVHSLTFQRILQQMLSSSTLQDFRTSLGHPKHWLPIMNQLSQRLLPSINSGVDDFITGHAQIATLIASSTEPMPDANLELFLKYLAKNWLLLTRAWIGYRVLEKYLDQPGLEASTVRQVLVEFLSKEVNSIRVQTKYLDLPDNKILVYKEFDIDPQHWFGFNESNYSLWVPQQAQNERIELVEDEVEDELAELGEDEPVELPEGAAPLVAAEDNQPVPVTPIPELLVDIFGTFIQSIKASHPGPMHIRMIGRFEAELPHDFTLPLAQWITDNEIYLETNRTVSTHLLGKPEFVSSITRFEDEKAQLAVKYPGAVHDKDEWSRRSNS